MAFEDKIDQESGLIYGRNSVVEFLKSNKKADVVYLSSSLDAKLSAFYAALAKENGAVLKTVPDVKLNHLCGSDRHQGIAASVTFCEYVSVESMLSIAKERNEAPFIIVADDIQDPHNMGAIIRTAECAGAHGLIIPKRGGTGITATVHRSSAGACSHLPIARVSNLAQTIRKLKENGVFCYCADMDGEVCYQANLTGPIALIIGSEGFGVSHLVKTLCDGVIALPMNGQINSLNASAAASALIYEIVRQRLIEK